MGTSKSALEGLELKAGDEGVDAGDGGDGGDAEAPKAEEEAPKKKKNNDDDEATEPASTEPFLEFVKEMRDKIKKDLGDGATDGEIKEKLADEVTKKLEDIWEELEGDPKEEQEDQGKDAPKNEKKETNEDDDEPMEPASTEPKKSCISAYIRFCTEIKESAKESIKDKYKGKPADAAKECPLRWKDLDDEEKETYEAEAADLNAKAGCVGAKKVAQSRGFWDFAEVMRDEIKKDLGDGATYGEVQEELEEAWWELNDEDKDNWSAQATDKGKKDGAKKVSAYYKHLVKDWRKIKEELGEEASTGEVMKSLGEVWKELHGGAKDKFAATAAALAAEQEAAEQEDQEDDAPKKEKKKKKKKSKNDDGAVEEA